MNHLFSDNAQQASNKKPVIDAQFEQNARVKIHHKENYGGGSGFYAVKAKPSCPNVNDGGRCNPGNTTLNQPL